MSDPTDDSQDERPALSRLDPDAASRAARPDASPAEPAGSPETDPTRARRERVRAETAAVDAQARRYRWAIGAVGLAVIAGVSIWQFASRGTGSSGVSPGQRLKWFAAPLAGSNLDGDANLTPPCSAAQHDPRALNLCLDARRSPVVLSLFVLGIGACEHQVDALQALSGRYPSVRFLAVAVRGSRTATAREVRRHHWTIPVAYDRDGAVGSQYGLAVCPMTELAARGGIVRDRLIGDQWQTVAELTPRIRALAADR